MVTNGRKFYKRMTASDDEGVTLIRVQQKIPKGYTNESGETTVVPFMADKKIMWSIG